MIKKLIIIEGTDNSGKDTLINGLCEHFNDPELVISVHHFQRPKSKTNEDCAKEQNETFFAFVNDLVNTDDKNRIVILNRAWYGEYIYGTLYRERTKEDVIDMIHQCEDILIKNKVDTAYIQLIGDPSFLATHDDGQSLSEGQPDIINIEGELFREVFNQSHLTNKRIIEVNKFGVFIPKNVILETALTNININSNSLLTSVLNVSI